MMALLKKHGWLLLVLAVALGLRLWGLDFGLPALSRPDEQNIAYSAVMQIMQSFFAGHPSLNPEFFHYPSLYIYLLTIIYTLYYLAGHLTGLFPDAAHFINLYTDDWHSFLLLSRLLSVVFGVLNVWVIVRFADLISGSRQMGLLAGLLLAVTYLHVRDSHFGVTDIAATCLVTGCLWQAMAAYQQRNTKALYYSAILAGLAAATKYPAALVALAPLSAFYFWQRDAGHAVADFVQSTPLVKQALLLAGLIGGAFLLTSPFVLLDFGTFWQQFSTQQHSFGTLFDKQGLPKAWIRHVTFSLWHGVGPVYLLSGALGLLLSLRQNARLHAIPLIFALAYYLAIGNTYSAFVRYILPLVPVFCLYAILFLDWLMARLPDQLPAQVRSVVLTILWLVLAWHSISFSIQYDRLQATTDTRLLARDWLLQRLEPDDGVGIGKALSHIELPKRFRKFFLSVPERSGVPFGSAEQFLPVTRTRVETKPNSRGELNINTYTDIQALREHNIRYIVLAKSPLSFYQSPPPELAAAASNPNLELVQHIDPVPPGGQEPPETAYDFIDAFYTPYSDYADLERPGPELLIYAVRPAPTLADSAPRSGQTPR